MKSVLYVGATLMIGASIYGFIDYKKSQGNKEFNDMYTGVKSNTPVVIKEETKVPVIEKEIVVTEKKEVLKGNEEISNVTKAADQPVKKTIVKKTKKKRKLDSRLFSRAPLEDEILEELPPTSKTEEKTKTNNQEQ